MKPNSFSAFSSGSIKFKDLKKPAENPVNEDSNFGFSLKTLSGSSSVASNELPFFGPTPLIRLKAI